MAIDVPEVTVIVICVIQDGAERVMIRFIIIFDAVHDLLRGEGVIVNCKAWPDEAADETNT